MPISGKAGSVIVGIGTDIVDARRIAGSLDRFGEKFEARIFTDTERIEARRRADPALYFAKRFAAKEAVYKALSGAGIDGLGWREAEITNDERGAPVIAVTGACKRALERLTPDGYNPTINISLSDEPPYAVAFITISVVSQRKSMVSESR
jgi:holo-[acyl-carrier protein] synthase